MRTKVGAWAWADDPLRRFAVAVPGAIAITAAFFALAAANRQTKRSRNTLRQRPSYSNAPHRRRRRRRLRGQPAADTTSRPARHARADPATRRAESRCRIGRRARCAAHPAACCTAANHCGQRRRGRTRHGRRRGRGRRRGHRQRNGRHGQRHRQRRRACGSVDLIRFSRPIITGR